MRKHLQSEHLQTEHLHFTVHLLDLFAFALIAGAFAQIARAFARHEHEHRPRSRPRPWPCWAVCPDKGDEEDN